jgi:hypothetical protein
LSPVELDDALLRRRLEWADAQTLPGDRLELRDGQGTHCSLEVSRVEARANVPAGRQFSVLLRGPASPRLAQQLYAFHHARLGDYAFFITPVGLWEGGIEYEACFAHAS